MKEDIKYQKFKKVLKYVILFVLFCIIIYSCNIGEVNAESITTGAPKYTITENNGTTTTSTSVLIDFWGTNYWRGSPNFGVISTDVSIDTQEFYYTNSNWCVGKTLNVSGYIAGVFNFFADGGSVQVFNNNKAMTCTFAREESSRVKYSCIGEGGGTFKIAMYRNNASFSYDTGISRTIELSCDDTLSNVIESGKENTNSIIDNQNKNNEELKEELKENFNSCYFSRNLFNINSSPVNSNVTTSVSDNKILLVTNTNVGNTTLASSKFPLTLKKNTTYTLTFNYSRDNTSNSNLVGIRQTSSGGNWLSETPGMINSNGKVTLTFNSGDNTTAYLWFYIKNSSTQTAVLTNWIFDNVMLVEGSTSLPYEPYGEEICSNKIDETNDKLDNLNDSLNNNDIGGAQNEVNSFFNDFESNDFGLSDIITLPLTTIQSITSKSCTPLNLTLPYVNKSFQLPCMTTIYSKFEPFYSIYQTITFGVISYWVCVQIYAMVKGFKDPSKDEIEVMDL